MNTFADAVTNELTKSRKDGLTANGAVTRKTSGQSHLDLFAIVGAARNAHDDVIKLFIKAYADDKALALRIMLWARDVRGGAGERQTFRNVLRHLAANDPIVTEKLIPFVTEYGRADDTIESLPTESYLFNVAALHIKKQIEVGNGLFAKWCPRKGPIAIALRNAWKMTPKSYRKFIVNASNTVEQKMCAQQWNTIEFDKLPSLAGLRYQTALIRHCADKYEAFKNKLVNGEVSINAGTLFPHDIVSNIENDVGDATVLNEQWKALPNYLGDKTGNVLVMSDVSGSMHTSISGKVTCMDVSIALGMYTSERLTGAFKDLVLTFSSNPRFVKLRGNTLEERIATFDYTNWTMTTDLQAAFKLVLDTGLTHNVSAKDMPSTIIVVSDMEFDSCCNTTNFGAIKTQYENAGYVIPQIVFWNVNGRAGNNPVKFDANGTCMISGYSPSVLNTVLSGEEFDPMKIMFDTIGKERYAVADLIVA